MPKSIPFHGHASREISKEMKRFDKQARREQKRKKAEQQRKLKELLREEPLEIYIVSHPETYATAEGLSAYLRDVQVKYGNSAVQHGVTSTIGDVKGLEHLVEEEQEVDGIILLGNAHSETVQAAVELLQRPALRFSQDYSAVQAFCSELLAAREYNI